MFVFLFVTKCVLLLSRTWNNKSCIWCKELKLIELYDRSFSIRKTCSRVLSLEVVTCERLFCVMKYVLTFKSILVPTLFTINFRKQLMCIRFSIGYFVSSVSTGCIFAWGFTSLELRKELSMYEIMDARLLNYLSCFANTHQYVQCLKIDITIYTNMIVKADIYLDEPQLLIWIRKITRDHCFRIDIDICTGICFRCSWGNWVIFLLISPFNFWYFIYFMISCEEKGVVEKWNVGLGRI